MTWNGHETDTPEMGLTKKVNSIVQVAEKVRDVWTHPVLHDGRLYLRYHDTLFCYDVKQH